MRPVWTRAATTLALLVLAISCATAQDLSARRMELLERDVSVETLSAALDSRDALVARTAARVLPSEGRTAIPALQKALRSRDVLVRRNAAMNLHELGEAALPLIEQALRDENEFVRQGAVFALIAMRPSAGREALIEGAIRDESAHVQRAAVMAGRSSYRVAETIPLPKAGWLFRSDTDEVGREQEWFAADLDETGWEPIEIERFWEEQGPESGTGWYRLTLDLPDREPPTRAQLDFQAVDESTWVWVNGEFAGEHDLGPTGWEKPFRIDVTDRLKWGEPNQITVRVYNTAMAGGIWKPVRIVLLEPAE